MLLFGGLMLTALPFSIYYDDGQLHSIGLSAFLVIIFGAAAWIYFRKAELKISKREGYIVVVGSWLFMTMLGSLPYIIAGVFPDVSSAYFEAVSGITATGATVLSDIEAIPKSLLYWRSLTQWIGGMGIIVLMVALFPMLGIGGVELFVAEAPVGSVERIHPRIKEIAKRLWFIYLGLTVLLTALLMFWGMDFFDAINHSFTTNATGGFSTKNASIGHWDIPGLQYTIILFMFLGGVNYTLIYFGFKGRFKRVWRSDEFKFYLLGLLFLTVVVTAGILYHTDAGFEKSFRDAAFQVVAIVTTTGYATADYTTWSTTFTIIFMLLFFVGGCAGSTSGGIKVIRHLVFFKNSLQEFKRLLHPNAIVRMKVDNTLVAPRTLQNILVFLLIYLFLFVIGTIIMSVVLQPFDHPFQSAIGAAAACLGNIGPAIGDLGPMDNFGAVPPLGKWVLCFFMLLGRLELFTVLIILSPYFWKSN